MIVDFSLSFGYAEGQEQSNLRNRCCMQTRVIGAGTAGLTAVHILQGAERSVKVLEARERIGGRVFTNRTFLANFVRRYTPVESGAEFIHDTAPT